mgnify:CR=1 FL=1
MLNNLLLVFHVLIAVAMVALILLQQGKGADAGAAFGGGASGTVFGSQGSGTFLSRATGILAALFFVSSLGLAYLANEGAQATSVVDQLQTEQTDKTLPVEPEATDQEPVTTEQPSAPSLPVE